MDTFDQLLSQYGLTFPKKINRAVLVGTSRGPKDVLSVEGVLKICTTWGESDGHHEDGSLPEGLQNLPLVAHWHNMAKSARSDADMRELLRIHAAAAQGRPASHELRYGCMKMPLTATHNP